MRNDEIRGKDDADLEVILAKTRRELFDLRFKTATGEVQSPHTLRDMKRTVAKIETVLHERRLGIRGAVPHKDDE